MLEVRNATKLMAWVLEHFWIEALGCRILDVRQQLELYTPGPMIYVVGIDLGTGANQIREENHTRVTESEEQIINREIRVEIVRQVDSVEGKLSPNLWKMSRVQGDQVVKALAWSMRLG